MTQAHTQPHTHTLTNTQMGTKTRQYIYREEGSSIKRTLKISVWLTLVDQSQICDYSKPWQTNSEIQEKLLVAPGQLKMSSIFPVLLFSTSHLDWLLSS